MGVIGVGAFTKVRFLCKVRAYQSKKIPRN